MASLSITNLRNLYKLSSRTIAAVNATSSAFPVRCFSINSHGAVFTQFTPKSPEGYYSARNPFQCDGPKGPFEKFISVHDEMSLRIDMPGVEKEGVKIWGENQDTVYFSGEAPKEWEYEECGRRYAGRFHLGCGCCHVKGVKSSVENGVVNILVSMAKIE